MKVTFTINDTAYRAFEKYANVPFETVAKLALETEYDDILHLITDDNVPMVFITGIEITES